MGVGINIATHQTRQGRKVGGDVGVRMKRVAECAVHASEVPRNGSYCVFV